MEDTSMKFIGVGLTMLGGAIGAGYGISTVFAAWLEAIGRNPSAEDKLRTWGIIGFAGTELVLLMSFVVAALLIFVV